MMGGSRLWSGRGKYLGFLAEERRGRKRWWLVCMLGRGRGCWGVGRLGGFKTDWIVEVEARGGGQGAGRAEAWKGAQGLVVMTPVGRARLKLRSL